MLDLECYLIISSKTKILIWWKVSSYKWHNNHGTQMFTVTDGDKQRAPLSGHLGFGITVHNVTKL